MLHYAPRSSYFALLHSLPLHALTLDAHQKVVVYRLYAQMA